MRVINTKDDIPKIRRCCRTLSTGSVRRTGVAVVQKNCTDAPPKCLTRNTITGVVSLCLVCSRQHRSVHQTTRTTSISEVVNTYKCRGGGAHRALLKTLRRLKIGRPTPEPRAAEIRQRVLDVCRRLAPEVLDQLTAEYQAGMSTPALAAQYNIGKATVLKLLQERGIARRGQGRKNIDLAEAIARYQAGWSLARLASAYQCNAETVRLALKARGVMLRPRNGCKY